MEVLENRKYLENVYSYYDKFFTDYFIAVISDSQRYKICGNGWTSDVISHIFNYIGSKPILNFLDEL